MCINETFIYILKYVDKTIVYLQISKLMAGLNPQPFLGFEIFVFYIIHFSLRHMRKLPVTWYQKMVSPVFLISSNINKWLVMI